MIKPSIIWL